MKITKKTSLLEQRVYKNQVQIEVILVCFNKACVLSSLSGKNDNYFYRQWIHVGKGLSNQRIMIKTLVLDMMMLKPLTIIIIVGLKIDTLTIFLLSESANKPIYRGTKELLLIDEKEFLTVSKLVRGRAKLQDVNKVCLKIYNTWKSILQN